VKNGASELVNLGEKIWFYDTVSSQKVYHIISNPTTLRLDYKHFRAELIVFLVLFTKLISLRSIENCQRPTNFMVSTIPQICLFGYRQTESRQPLAFQSGCGYEF